MPRTQQEVIYLDYAATTPVDPEVVDVMQPWLREEYGNPSSMHTLGHRARRAVDDARARVAAALGCSTMEVVFTAGGTESDNLAILGVMRQAAKGSTPTAVHMVTSSIEHAAVRDTAAALRGEGYGVTEVRPQPNGVVSVESVVDALRDTTALVSVMLANNEIGTIQPIADIAARVKQHAPRVVVHTDACQAMGLMDVNLAPLSVDLITINGSKIYGPKGVGALVVKRGVKLQPMMYGGGQEYGLRPGTENVAGIVGFAKAVELVVARRAAEAARLLELRDRLIDWLCAALPGTVLNGDRELRLANNVNVTIPRVDGESLLFALDQEGIAVSLGSACASGAIEPSHVLLGIGRSREEARSSVRLTLGAGTTPEHIETVLQILPRVVEQLRKR